MNLEHDRDSYKIIEMAFELYVQELKRDLAGAMKYSKLNNQNLTEPDYDRANDDIQFVLGLKNKILKLVSNNLYSRDMLDKVNTQNINYYLQGLDEKSNENYVNILKHLHNIHNMDIKIDYLLASKAPSYDLSYDSKIKSEISRIKDRIKGQFNKIHNILQKFDISKKEFDEIFYTILQSKHVNKFQDKLDKLFKQIP
jgi:hypothetical protein